MWDEKDALCSFPSYTCEAATEIKAFMETQKTMKFLMGLNESFEQTRSNIIGMDSLPSLSKAYAIELQQEKQSEVAADKATTISESAAFFVKSLGRETSLTEKEAADTSVNSVRRGNRDAQSFLTITPNNSNSTTLPHSSADDSSNPITTTSLPFSSPPSSPNFPSNSPPNIPLETEHTPSSPPQLPVHRSTCTTKVPTALHDFHIEAALPSRSVPSSSSAEVVNPDMARSLSNVLTYTHLSSPHRVFTANISLHREPSSFSKVVKDQKWREVMRLEIEAMQFNKTWSLVAPPAHKRPIGCKWVYKIKFNPDDTIERYKARLVAKGYSQIKGLDYRETFAPVAKFTTVRVLLNLATQQNWHLHQLDVNNAFLNGDLHEDVYMQLPPRFERKGEQHVVCKLHKSLYGLKQASRQWFLKLSAALKAAVFRQSWSDYSLFVQNHHGTFTTLLVYVDDVILAGNSLDDITRTKAFLSSQFKLKDMGKLSIFLD
ncbi:hypothetical protein ACLB2K_040490 [Fragaria x ananassa]